MTTDELRDWFATREGWELTDPDAGVWNLRPDVPGDTPSPTPATNSTTASRWFTRR